MSAARAERPMPRPTPDSAPYFEAAARGCLELPQCAGCSRFHWWPSPRCPHCGSRDIEWTACAGGGTLYSYTVVHAPALPYFVDKVPYVLGLVAITDAPGIRLLANVLDLAPQDVRIGMALEVTFESLPEGLGLVQFRVPG